MPLLGGMTQPSANSCLCTRGAKENSPAMFTPKDLRIGGLARGDLFRAVPTSRQVVTPVLRKSGGRVL